MDIIKKIDDLIEQATKERSHYYTASVLKEARQVIEDLRYALEREWQIQARKR